MTINFYCYNVAIDYYKKYYIELHIKPQIYRLKNEDSNIDTNFTNWEYKNGEQFCRI
jgi:hypothetical protein